MDTIHPIRTIKDPTKLTTDENFIRKTLYAFSFVNPVVMEKVTDISIRPREIKVRKETKRKG